MRHRINIVTVWTGERYVIEYVQKMRSMLERHLQMDMGFYCITDRPEEIDWIKIKPPEVLDGWWNKLLLFSDLMPAGPIVYFDLDQIILDDITPMIEQCLLHPIACYADHINYCGVKFGSSFITFLQGSYLPLFSEFWENRDEIQKTEGGDQVWIGKQFEANGIEPFYINEHFPGSIQSYKWDYLKDGLTKETKIINLHGLPKPHNLKTPLILEHWH